MKKSAAVLLIILLISVLSACGDGADGTSAAPETAPQSQAFQGEGGRYIYLAGPFFNETEIANIELTEKILTEKGLTFFSPMRHEVDAVNGTTEWAYKIFEMDKEEIGKSTAVVALYYGSSSDTGTAWECGYAAAIGKPVILVHVNEDGDSNLMMHCGASTNIYLKDLAAYDFDAMPVYEYLGKMF